MVSDNDMSRDAVLARTSVLDGVRRIVAEQLGQAPEEIAETHHLENDLGCDSLDIVEITMEVEEHFDISIPDDYGDQIRTVGHIVDGVMDLLGKSAKGQV